MEKLLYWVKIIAAIQMIMIIIFIFLINLTKSYFNWLDEKNTKKKKWITNFLDSYLKEKEELTRDTIQKLKNSITQVLIILDKIEDKKALRTLSELVLKPTARKLFSSSSWFKRYNAASCYTYGFDAEDEDKILHLLQDNNVLISINAAISIVKFGTSSQMNKMISVFSTKRRLHQSAFAEIITIDRQELSPIIIDRLEKEEDLYAKLFCYRLLCKFPQQTIASIAEEDLKVNSVDLKIAVIHYLSHCQDNKKKELLYQYARDEHWEIRSAIAKALGEIKDDPKTIQLLSQLLQDSQWWVRINAGNSLSKLGPEGINILKSQSPEKDKFAYETAQKILITKENV
jgi:HEAT repeat protein